MASMSVDYHGQPDWVLAKHGFNLFINNKGEEAETLFLKHSDSLTMFSGYSYVVFMDALMSFEEDKLTKAISTLKEVEKRCDSRSWFKYFKTKVFGSADVEPSVTDTLETQIILADSQVCLAILVFLQQDISGFLKAGWVLRKAWSVYHSTYTEILNLYNSQIGPLNLPDPTVISPSSENGVNIEKEIFSSNLEVLDLQSSTGKTIKPEINKKVIIRLMNSVAFGYGLFQLGVSLLSPTLFKLTSFLGLKGNRMHGLACLMYARLGVDMRAPLATLSLLWYHCIIRPYYGFDGTNVAAGAQMSSQLIRETSEEYAESAIFLFFKGRVCRLNSDIPAALAAFQESVNNATQREVKVLSLHEVGWCYLIQLDFKNADVTFALLSTWSRWSRPFYCYITCICKGSRGEFVDYAELEELIVNIRASSKGNNLDEFLTRRVQYFPGRQEFSELPVTFWRFFVYEMLYLWNSLASCTKQGLTAIIEDCNLNSPAEEPMKGIAKLIEGSCNAIIGDTNAAVICFRKCIEQRSDKVKSEDAHVLAFAQYELASILITTPETKEEGRGLLHQTVLIKDYDFEDRLVVRVNSILKHG